MSKRKNCLLALGIALITHQIYAMYAPVDKQLNPAYAAQTSPTSSSAASSPLSSSGTQSAAPSPLYPDITNHRSSYIDTSSASSKDWSQNKATQTPTIENLDSCNYSSTSKKLILSTTVTSAAVGFLSGAIFTARETRNKEASLVIGTGFGLVGGFFGFISSFFYTPETKFNEALISLKQVNKETLIHAVSEKGILVDAINQSYQNTHWPLIPARHYYLAKAKELDSIETQFKNAESSAHCWPYTHTEFNNLLYKSGTAILRANELKHNAKSAANAIQTDSGYQKQLANYQAHQKNEQDRNYQEQRLQQERERNAIMKAQLNTQSRENRHRRH